MVEAIGLPREKLCLYCWLGEYPRICRRKTKIDIKETRKPAAKKADKDTLSQTKLW
jgi:hypothetical protein